VLLHDSTEHPRFSSALYTVKVVRGKACKAIQKGSKVNGRKFFRELFCWHSYSVCGHGYVGYVIVECVKCGRRKAVGI
jgi:hypothetical protein